MNDAAAEAVASPALSRSQKKPQRHAGRSTVAAVAAAAAQQQQQQQQQEDEEEQRRRRYLCTARLEARDRMNNALTSGGCHVACGFLDAEDDHGDIEVDDYQLSSSCVDGGDGTYVLKWVTARPGRYLVYVKLEGEHVQGSPARLWMRAPDDAEPFPPGAGASPESPKTATPH